MDTWHEGLCPKRSSCYIAICLAKTETRHSGEGGGIRIEILHRQIITLERIPVNSVFEQEKKCRKCIYLQSNPTGNLLITHQSDGVDGAHTEIDIPLRKLQNTPYTQKSKDIEDVQLHFHIPQRSIATAHHTRERKNRRKYAHIELHTPQRRIATQPSRRRENDSRLRIQIFILQRGKLQPTHQIGQRTIRGCAY